MRTRSEAKRREIIAVAAQAFEEIGYERTSMLTIAERLRGSKQTLYNYFPSKEDLLRAVLSDRVLAVADSALDWFMDAARQDLRAALIRGGVAYLTDQLSPTMIALTRIVANLPADSDLGAQFYNGAVHEAWQRFADYLETLMDEGLLRRADPWLAAMQFKALDQLDLYERRLLGADREPDPAAIAQTAESAADAFIILYAMREEAS